MNRTETKKPDNLLDLKPRQNAPWESDDDGRVVLLVPKFENQILAKWLTPRLSKPNFRVKLDEFGSFVWKHCDGRTPVSAIVERMRLEFGDSAEPVHERIGSFLQRLERDKFILTHAANDLQ